MVSVLGSTLTCWNVSKPLDVNSIENYTVATRDSEFHAHWSLTMLRISAERARSMLLLGYTKRHNKLGVNAAMTLTT